MNKQFVFNEEQVKRLKDGKLWLRRLSNLDKQLQEQNKECANEKNDI